MAGRDATIYVKLLGEGVDVWRPVAASRIDGETYRLLSDGLDGGIETLEFQPGDAVRVEPRGEDLYLVAVARAGPG